MAEAKMNEILRAAMALFSRKGYLKTTLTEVAREVGITKGGLYHYISSKDELLFLIHKQMVDAFLSVIRNSNDSESDPKTQLFTWIHAHLNSFRNYKANIKISFDELHNLENKSDIEGIISSRDEIFDMLYQIIVDGIKKKQFRNDIHPKILTFLIFGMLNWFYRWYDPHGARGIEQIYDDIIKLISGGILTASSA